MVVTKCERMDVQKEIEKILERNNRVEADKAWEKSRFRLIILLLFTYVVAFFFMYIVGLKDAWLAAFVPVIGYSLSTLTLPQLKRWWIRKWYKN